VKSGAVTDALYLVAEMNFYRHSPYFLIDLDEIWCRMFPRISVEQLRGCEKRVLLQEDVNEILLVFFKSPPPIWVKFTRGCVHKDLLSVCECRDNRHSENVNEFLSVLFTFGARGGAVVETLRYKPEGRGIDSRWCHWKFSLT
jgi:hypothetical protein